MYAYGNIRQNYFENIRHIFKIFKDISCEIMEKELLMKFLTEMISGERREHYFIPHKWLLSSGDRNVFIDPILTTFKKIPFYSFVILNLSRHRTHSEGAADKL